jgi:hypothetical protein
VSSEVSIGGDGCRLRLTVDAYEFPDIEDFDDANWLVGKVELEAGVTGSFRASHRVTPRTDDLTLFRDELRPIVDTLSGEATLHHLEEQFGCTVSLTDGKGALTAFVGEHIGSTLRVEQCETDQSYLAQTLRELDALLTEFPVRGRRRRS